MPSIRRATCTLFYECTQFVSLEPHRQTDRRTINFVNGFSDLQSSAGLNESEIEGGRERERERERDFSSRRTD